MLVGAGSLGCAGHPRGCLLVDAGQAIAHVLLEDAAVHEYVAADLERDRLHGKSPGDLPSRQERSGSSSPLGGQASGQLRVQRVRVTSGKIMKAVWGDVAKIRLHVHHFMVAVQHVQRATGAQSLAP